MIPDYIRKTLSALNDAGFEAYIVGGAVRDTLRGVPVHDYDITTSALPDTVTKVMTSAGFKLIIDSSSIYGTVVFTHPDAPSNKVEVTTFRSDKSYSDRRHPDDVNFTSSLEKDAARRDFTINSLYMDINENIQDPNGGRADIDSGIIRAIGNPSDRFNEDALRILRAVRFEAVTGFTIEGETSAAMAHCALLLKNISAERVFAEFTGIVTGPYGPDAIRHNIEVVSVIIPELKLQVDFDQKSKFHDRDLLTHTLDVLAGIPLGEDGVKDAAVAYSAVLHDIGKPQVFTIDEDGVGHMKKHNVAGMFIAERLADELKFPNILKQEVSQLVMYHDSFPEPVRKSVRKFIAAVGVPLCDKLFALQKADVEAHSVYGKPRIERLKVIMSLYDEIMAEEPCLTVKDLKVRGGDVIGLGIEKGPMVGKVLDDVLARVLDEQLNNDKDEIINYIKDCYSL